MDKKSLLIFGAGGHASKIIDIAEQKFMSIIGFISTEPKGTNLYNYVVVANLDEYIIENHYHNIPVHIAIGHNHVRQNIFESIAQVNPIYSRITANSSYISPNCHIADGTAVLHHAIVHRGAHIGKCCIIDTGSIIEHDCHLGDFINISPGAVLCGNVMIGNNAIIGANVVVREKTIIGEHTLIGAGAVVLENIPPFSVVVGNPARIIRQRTPNEPYLK